MTESIQQKKPIEWNDQQEKLLQNWAEISGSYRWLHNQAYGIYRKKNLNFMIPLIVMSTVTGTANFAQATFPEVIRPYVPQIIGAINLISAIMTTIYQFLKISEYMESHRITSINYGKFCRNITVELNLPVKNRSIGGNDLVKISRNDIDRLIEQSPSIPNKILKMYQAKFAGQGLAQPEILHINKVDIYHDEENKATNALVEAGLKFKKALFQKKPVPEVSNSPLASVRDRVSHAEQKLNNWESTIKELKTQFNPEEKVEIIINDSDQEVIKKPKLASIISKFGS
jgi:hypothetical protein